MNDAGLGMTRLAWLTRPSVEATASAVLTSVRKLAYLRSMDADTLDLSMLPAERRRFLATVGRRSTVQGLMRREERRYPILLALVAQSAVDQLDEVIALFDRAVSARESRARVKTDEQLVERAKKGESRQLLMDIILPVLADQTEQAWSLTVLTNAVITWTTEYYQIAVRDLRARGRAVPDGLLAHISPARSENVNFFGVITVDVEAELARLGPAGWRPLRPAAPDLNTVP